VGSLAVSMSAGLYSCPMSDVGCNHVRETVTANVVLCCWCDDGVLIRRHGMHLVMCAAETNQQVDL